MQTKISSNIIRQVLLLIIILSLGIFLGLQVKNYLVSFLGSITLYILLRPINNKLVRKYKWKKWLSATFIIISILILIIIPLILILNYGYNQVLPLIKNPEILNQWLITIKDFIESKINLTISSTKINSYITTINKTLIDVLQKTLGNTINLFTDFSILLFILYFMLEQSEKFESMLRNMIPFKIKNTQKFIIETKNIIYSNTIGIPIMAILQGLAGTLGYAIFGMSNFLMWGLLTAITSMLPVVGSMIIYLPLSIYKLAVGDTWQGVGILIWGLLIIGSVDNVARMFLARKLANIHPLITIFGVLIGLNVFGFLGLIFGPLLISTFFLLISIYKDEFGKR